MKVTKLSFSYAIIILIKVDFYNMIEHYIN